MKAQLVAVQRDAAKQLFSHRDPDALLSYVRELSQQSGVLTLELPTNWEEYDAVFAGAEGEHATIQWAISGGRDMSAGSKASQLQMKRPDIVGQLAVGVSQFAMAVAGEHEFCDPRFYGELARFYTEAAEQQAAVLFFS
jgi:hypothetical protein